MAPEGVGRDAPALLSAGRPLALLAPARPVHIHRALRRAALVGSPTARGPRPLAGRWRAVWARWARPENRRGAGGAGRVNRRKRAIARAVDGRGGTTVRRSSSSARARRSTPLPGFARTITCWRGWAPRLPSRNAAAAQGLPGVPVTDFAPTSQSRACRRSRSRATRPRDDCWLPCPCSSESSGGGATPGPKPPGPGPARALASESGRGGEARGSHQGGPSVRGGAPPRRETKAVRSRLAWLGFVGL